MNRRGFLKSIAGVIAGACTVGMAKPKKDAEPKTNAAPMESFTISEFRGKPRLVWWEGCDEPNFSDPHPVDYVSVLRSVIELTGKPKYRYLRFVCSPDFNRSFYFKGESLSILETTRFITKDDILDLGLIT